MSHKAWTLIAGALLAGLIVGLYAGYKVGWAVRDYDAAQETIARDEAMQDTNTELQELRLRLALVNADLAGMTRELEWKLGICAGPRPRPSEGDRP